MLLDQKDWLTSEEGRKDKGSGWNRERFGEEMDREEEEEDGMKGR